jgi:hypothetical protein
MIPRPKSLRAAVSEQAPLLIALVLIALLVAFTRMRKTASISAKPAPAAPAPPFVPSEPEPIPLEPPFGPLRAENAELPCGVDEVLASKCRRCHATPPRHNAPFPLFTWTDLQALRGSDPLYQVLGRVVQNGFMPLRIPTNPPIEPLTEGEKKTLLDWVSSGAPRGTCKPTATKKQRVPTQPMKGPAGK